MQVNDGSTSQPNTRSTKSRDNPQKKLVEELKGEWKQLWSERFNDQVRAEGVSSANYQGLRVERGTIIHATRDYKPLNFKEILDEHKVENAERYIQPDVNVGGWNKFVKTQITQPKTKHAAPEAPKKSASQQPKKGGRGWLHTT